MNAESIIKGRTAGLIVSLMFQEGGYSVLRYGYEGVPEALVQIGSLKKQKVLELLASTPHFVITDKKKGDIFLVSVKFQGDDKSGRSIAQGFTELAKFWPYSELIIVRPKEPFFFSVNHTQRETKIKHTPLKEVGTFKISAELIRKYGQIARKFLA